MSLDPILRTAISHFRSGHLDTEEEVKAAVILPVLLALGWNLADRSIRPEYRAGPGRVNYALLCHGRPQVFIEAKRPGALDVRAEEQLFGYASNAGIPLLVLTDGRFWDFYLSMADGPPTERRFRRLELRDASGVPAYAEILETCLGNRRVASGEARRRAEMRLENDRNRKTARDTIPEAWNALLTEPDELLCELLAEQVQRKTGIGPERSDVENFLKTLPPVPARSTASTRPPGRQTAMPAGKKSFRNPDNEVFSGHASGSAVLRGAADDTSSRFARNEPGRGEHLQDIVYDLMRVVLEQHPELLGDGTLSYLENTKHPKGTKLGYPLIRRSSNGREIAGRPRYKKEKFAGQWYVCTEWNKAYHHHNARALSQWVESLNARANSPEARDCLESILSRLSSWEKSSTS